MSRSGHLVDHELAPLLEAFPTTTITNENLQELRARQLPLPPPGDDAASVEDRVFAGPAGPLPMRIYQPLERSEAVGCIFHVHGGGYVGGSAREVEFLHKPLAARLGCVIVSIDYRLAPEAPFPAAIDDCYAALKWTFANAADLGVDATRIGVMGESAGGGIAAALALVSRDRGEHRLSFQHLIYPMIDDRTCTREPHPYAGEFIWHPDNNLFGWTAYLGEEPGGEGVSPYAAVARAENLSGLPPTFLSTAALDLFIDENLDFAGRLIRAGVPTELHVWPGAFHGFDIVPGVAVADAARGASTDALARFLREHR